MSFQINVTPIGLTAAQSNLVGAAQNRISKIIVAAPKGVPANAVFKIKVKSGPIDLGRNAVSQTFGPWPDATLPTPPIIWIQEKEIAELEKAGLLANIVEHEILHCLGFGLAWGGYPDLVQRAGGGAVFRGKAAWEQYNRLLTDARRAPAAFGIPLELDGGVGKEAMHWREGDFKDEIMSAKQGGTPGKLSAMTIASLADLGYGVNMGYADDYRLP